MKVSEAIEKLTVKRDDALRFQKLYRGVDVGWSANESKAIAFNIAINTLEQIDEPQAEKVEVPEFVAEWYESNKYELERAIIDMACSMEKGEFPYNLPFEDWFIDPENHPIETLISMMKDGYTVKPKRWVVRTSSAYFEQFSGDSNHPFNFDATHNIYVALTFNDRAKAEAVATLVDGSVEEV